MLVLLVSACTGGSATPTPAPDPNALLIKAASDFKALKAVRFKLQLAGAPAYVDDHNTIAFVSAVGSYTEPDRVQAKVVARLLGVPGEVEIVAIGDSQWYRNAVLTGNRWLNQVFSPGFNAAKLIRSDQGIENALKTLKGVELIGAEDLFGVQTWHIRGRATAADIAALTVGLIRGKDVVADLFINIQTGRVERVVLVQPETKTDQEPLPTTWTVEIYDYNAPDVKIDAPPAATAQATADGSGIGLPTSIPLALVSPTPLPTIEATQAR